MFDVNAAHPSFSLFTLIGSDLIDLKANGLDTGVVTHVFLRS